MSKRTVRRRYRPARSLRTRGALAALAMTALWIVLGTFPLRAHGAAPSSSLTESLVTKMGATAGLSSSDSGGNQRTAGQASSGTRLFQQAPEGPLAAGANDGWVTISSGQVADVESSLLDSGDSASTYISPFDACDERCGEVWQWHILPDGLIYRSYLAGARESRIGSFWAHEKDQGWIWDAALGGRVGLLRYGTSDSPRPEGWQLDVEGAGLPRLGIDDDLDVIAVDFRFGVPLTYGCGRYQTKFAYYHLSSHLGDEFLLQNPTFQRLNFVRDVLVWGHSYHVSRDVRVYGEAGWAWKTDGGAEPWEFQFGVDYSPACPTGFRGAPFFAVNAHLREEVDFGGNLVVQVGWAWRGPGGGHLARMGLEYFNGKDEQFEFFDESQEKLGFGLWYDY